jgi:hypothetical protein
MYRNWIKILNLNKVKKEKGIHKKQHLMSKSKETKPQQEVKKNLAEKRH